jgi:hypothetical protein
MGNLNHPPLTTIDIYAADHEALTLLADLEGVSRAEFVHRMIDAWCRANGARINAAVYQFVSRADVDFATEERRRER